MGRISAIYFVTTLLVVELFHLLARPVRAAITDRLIATATTALADGQPTATLAPLAQAKQLGASDAKIAPIQTELTRLDTDYAFAYGYYSSHHNESKAQQLQLVIQPYSDGRSILLAVQQLLDQQAITYATVLLDRAKQQFPDYNGNNAVTSYLNAHVSS